MWARACMTNFVIAKAARHEMHLNFHSLIAGKRIRAVRSLAEAYDHNSPTCLNCKHSLCAIPDKHEFVLILPSIEWSRRGPQHRRPDRGYPHFVLARYVRYMCILNLWNLIAETQNRRIYACVNVLDRRQVLYFPIHFEHRVCCRTYCVC